MDINENLKVKTFEEAAWQEESINNLKNEIMSGRIRKNYILRGENKSGIINTANLIAMAVNCLDKKDGSPCFECENCSNFKNGSHPDVIIADAATPEGNDNFMNTEEKAKKGLSLGKYMVLIVKNAQEVLKMDCNIDVIKALPEQVVSIFCISDDSFVYNNTLENSLELTFNKLSTEKISEYLEEKSANQYGINIEDRTIALLARLSQGLIENADSLLEKAAATSADFVVNHEEVMKALGISENMEIQSIVKSVLSMNKQKSIEDLQNVLKENEDAVKILKDLTYEFRNVLFAKDSSSPKDVITASEGDIAFYKEAAKDAAIDKIIDIINVLQEAEEKIIKGNNPIITLELAVVKCSAETEQNKLLRKIEELEKRLDNLGKNTKTSETSVPQSAYSVVSKTLIEKVASVYKEQRNAALTAAVRCSNFYITGNTLMAKVNNDRCQQIFNDNADSIINGFRAQLKNEKLQLKIERSDNK